MPESKHSAPTPGASEQQTPPEEHAAWEELIEIIEVIVRALVAIAKLRNIRVATTTIAFALLIYTAISVAQLPRPRKGC
jgi:hypothetical protein